MRRLLSAAGAGALLLLAAAAPGYAAIEEPTPAQDAVVSSHADLRFTSTVQFTTQLQATGPGEPPVVVTTEERTTGEGEGARPPAGRSTLLLRTKCPLDPGGDCTGAGVAPNGAWTVTESGIGGGDTRTFFLRIGGLPVPDLAATIEGRKVTVTWRGGPEPDVKGYVVSDGQNPQPIAAPCPETGCSAVFEYGPTETGSRTYTVRAARPCGVEGCDDVLGAAAVSAPVQLPPAPTPSTGRTPPPGGGTAAPTAPGTAAPGPTGGTGRADNRSLGSGFTSFAPKLGVSKLPPLPEAGAPQVAAPLPDTFEDTLGYDPEIALEEGEQEPVAPPQAGRPDTRLTSTGGLIDEQVARGLAGALVLAMSGAHLRSWLSRTRPEDEL